MSRYIDAEVLCKNNFMCDCDGCEDCYKTKEQKIDCEYYSTYSLQDFCSWITDTPTADVVEVVRCKDCKHSSNHIEPHLDNYGVQCGNMCFCQPQQHWVRLNGFCDEGERKNDDER